MQKAMKPLWEHNPEAHIKAHEVADIDHRAMVERRSKARATWGSYKGMSAMPRHQRIDL
jgi:hypothetical protein